MNNYHVSSIVASIHNQLQQLVAISNQQPMQPQFQQPGFEQQVGIFRSPSNMNHPLGMGNANLIRMDHLVSALQLLEAFANQTGCINLHNSVMDVQRQLTAINNGQGNNGQMTEPRPVTAHDLHVRQQTMLKPIIHQQQAFMTTAPQQQPFNQGFGFNPTQHQSYANPQLSAYHVTGRLEGSPVDIPVIVTEEEKPRFSCLLTRLELQFTESSNVSHRFITFDQFLSALANKPAVAFNTRLVSVEGIDCLISVRPDQEEALAALLKKENLKELESKPLFQSSSFALSFLIFSALREDMGIKSETDVFSKEHVLSVLSNCSSDDPYSELGQFLKDTGYFASEDSSAWLKCRTPAQTNRLRYLVSQG